MSAHESTLEPSVGQIRLKNPFLPASGPPTAYGEQIRHGFRHGFRRGWAGAVTKTIVQDTMEISDVSPRFAVWKDTKAGFLDFENFELLSKRDVSHWTGEIAAIREEYQDNREQDKASIPAMLEGNSLPVVSIRPSPSV